MVQLAATGIQQWAERKGKKLFQLLIDGTIEQIYNIPKKYVDFGDVGEFRSIRFSLTGRYVSVVVATSIETSVTKFFDLNNNADLFGHLCIERAQLVNCPPNNGPHGGPTSKQTFEEFADLVYWSTDDKVLVVSSSPDNIGGPGLDGLFISDYGSPEKMNVAFTRAIPSPPLIPEIYVPDINRPEQRSLTFLNFNNVEIDQVGIVRFNTIVDRDNDKPGNKIILEERKFEYDARTKKLNQLAYTSNIH